MLALANLRERWPTFLGAFTALALGVALITMTLLVYVSSLPKVPARVAGAPVIALAQPATDMDGTESDRRPWTDTAADDLAAKLGNIPGVSKAIADRSFYAQAVVGGKPVADPDAQAAGHGWSSAELAPYRLVAGNPPAAEGQVVIDTALGLAPGSTLRLLTAAGSRDMTVTGTVSGSGFFVSDQEATTLAPGVLAIGLLTEPGTSIEGVEGAAEVVVGATGELVSGEGRSVLEAASVSHNRWLGTQLSSAMTILGAFVTIFVVASTFALGAAQRRRELGLLRMVGAAPRQIRRMLLGEALLIGVAGAAAGTVVGVMAAPAMGWLLLKIGAASQGLSVRIELWPIVVAVLVGIVVALLGAWSASYRASKVTPVQALCDSQVENRPMTAARWVFGGGALAAGVLLAVLTATASADSRVDLALLDAMVLIVAAAMLAPLTIGPLVRLVTWRVPGSGALMIRAELLNAIRRTASTAAPIIATVGFAMLLSGMVATMRQAYPAGDAAKLQGLSVVVPDGTPGLSDATVAAVEGGSSSLPTRVFIDRTVIDAVGSARIAEPGTVVVPTSLAQKLGLREDATLPVGFADGETVPLRISAVRPGSDIVIARDLVRAHDSSALTDTIFIPRAAGPATVGPGAKADDAEGFAAQKYEKDMSLLGWFSLVLLVLAGGYTGIAVANTMAMAAQGRRTDFAVLRSAGATVRQVLLLVMGETALIVVIGTALGLLITLPPLAAMAAGLAESTGIPVGLRSDWPTVVIVVASCLTLAVTASVVMTWRPLRDRH